MYVLIIKGNIKFKLVINILNHIMKTISLKELINNNRNNNLKNTP